MATMCQASAERPENMEPSEARALFRRNGYSGLLTSGFCAGYAQFNVIILSSDFADEFEMFCHSNVGALPVLYRSKPGEIGAPPLAKESDIRKDLPCYVVYKNSVRVEEVQSLNSHSWNDLVTFYIGCSTTFDNALIIGGVESPNILDVPWLKSSIPCQPAGRFRDIEMYVSMRPILVHQIAKAFMISSQYPDYHGAPIHIGDPTRIGVTDCIVPDGYIPVFWACGFTVQDAIFKAKPEFTFSHYPGSMFLSDVQVKPIILDDSVEIVQLSQPGCNFFASVINSKSLTSFKALEQVLFKEDVPSTHSDLLKATLALSHAKHVLISISTEPPHTDICPAIVGALVLCQSLLTLEKSVTLYIQGRDKKVLEECIKHMAQTGILNDTASPSIVVENDDRLDTLADCVLLINKGCKIPLGLQETIESNPLITTIAITAFSEGKPLSESGTFTPDFVLATERYNIGGYALACGLFVATTSLYHWRYRNYAINAEKPPQFSRFEFLPKSEQINSLWNVINTFCEAASISSPTDFPVQENFLDIIK